MCCDGSKLVKTTSMEFKEVNKGEGPVLNGDVDFVVQGDSWSGYVIASQGGAAEVKVSIPTWMDPCSVLLEITPDTGSVRTNGARIRVVRDGMDITNYLDVLLPDLDGVIDFTRATVKEEIIKEVLDPAKGAKIELDAADPKLTTAPTRVGLFYRLREGATLGGMKDGDSKVGDGEPWTPAITVNGGNSAFYSIGVGKVVEGAQLRQKIDLVRHRYFVKLDE